MQKKMNCENNENVKQVNTYAGELNAQTCSFRIYAP